MHRIDNQYVTQALPIPAPQGQAGYFTQGDPSTGLEATIVDQDWLNSVQEELAAVALTLGAGLSKTDNMQVLKAIQAMIAGNTRQRLTAPLSLYVSPSGSDVNDGLTPASPFATPQAAWNAVMERYDLGGQPITVNVANGTYGALSAIGLPIGSLGAGVTFIGNTADPANVIWAGTNGPAVAAGLGAILALEGIRLQAGGTIGDYRAAPCGITGIAGAAVSFDKIDFGPCAFAHMQAATGANVSAIGTNASYTVSGGATFHTYPWAGGIVTTADATLTFNILAAFSGAFAAASQGGSLSMWGMSFGGSATGPRYSITGNAVLNINGANPDTYLPGNAAGTKATGGEII